MSERTLWQRSVLVWGGLALAAAALFGLKAWTQGSGLASGAGSVEADLTRAILFHGTLPRAAVALLAGTALALSGVILQRVLRNPLAEPSTLGIFSGANVAMALAALYAPSLLESGREGVAFAGGLAVMGLILSLTWRRGFEPVSLVLAGMMVSLAASSLSAALVLANGEYLYTLFIWGGGSLVQQGWQPALAISLCLIVAAFAVAALRKPLAILALDDQGAQSLGVTPIVWRCLAVAVAVGLATTIAAEVGVIGFVGLAAPALAGLSGARRFSQKLWAAPVIGAILLWLTDGLVQLAATANGERFPTGAATALLGGPLLLWMLTRLRLYEWRSLAAGAMPLPSSKRPFLLIGLIALATGLTAALAIALGKGPDGWQMASGALLADLAAWRAPRIAVAATAGAMLGAAGTIMQRMTGNPLASPELLGVSSGAGVGLAIVLSISPAAGMDLRFLGLACGAFAAIGVLLGISAHARIGPERLLLAGIAIGAMGNAVVTAIIATGNQQSFTLLAWLSGTTHDATPDDAWKAALAAVMLIVPAAFTVRWLTVLPLGSAVAAGLGLEVRRVRVLLIVLCGLLSAAAALFIGPLSFVGLIAPHIARGVGLTRASTHLAGAVVMGAALLIVADWGSRWIAFPYELPLSLFASLIAGPYLIYLLSKGMPRNA
jgi:iron complex transport system permease protein